MERMREGIPELGALDDRIGADEEGTRNPMGTALFHPATPLTRCHAEIGLLGSSNLLAPSTSAKANFFCGLLIAHVANAANYGAALTYRPSAVGNQSQLPAELATQIGLIKLHSSQV